MNNKVLILLAKAVCTVFLFFIGHLILQYLDKGIVRFTSHCPHFWTGRFRWQGDCRLF